MGSTFVITTITHNRALHFSNSSLAEIAVNEINHCASDGFLENHAWVVMPDHIHWLLTLRKGNLGNCLQTFKSRSARAINMLSGTCGPVWQSGFYDHCLRDDEDLLKQARYLALNPVRRGLVSRIEDYPFWWCRWIQNSADL